MPTVTPLLGPIFLRNGSVPVVPLYSYPTMNNGTLMQIPVSHLLIISINNNKNYDLIGVTCCLMVRRHIKDFYYDNYIWPYKSIDH